MSELQCYNRGCGKKYLESENSPESCRHHPGMPIFHDAYKGWSCCNKKCTDFTEFLNIKGCTLSKHSNVKPPEPEKPVCAIVPDEEVIVVQPITKTALPRPPLDTPMTKIMPEIASSLLQSLKSAQLCAPKVKPEGQGILIGTICKNGGCNMAYEGPDKEETECVHHPGTPIFHEGLKYWSCCQKRTSDFNAFLSQVGCSTGPHVWQETENDSKTIQCRWDLHQTVTHVIVSIYAKQYDPTASTIEMNPIRLTAKITFPSERNAVFCMDHELQGIIDVPASNVTMHATKIEIKLKKAEPGSWSRLEVASKTPPHLPAGNGDNPEKEASLVSKVESVDLSDL